MYAMERETQCEEILEAIQDIQIREKVHNHLAAQFKLPFSNNQTKLTSDGQLLMDNKRILWDVHSVDEDLTQLSLLIRTFKKK